MTLIVEGYEVVMKFVNVEAAIACGDRWLMIERSAKEAHAGGTVSFVGGKVDELTDGNDVLETTLQREVLEEVGIAIESPPRYVMSSHLSQPLETRW